jgi:two-component system KDP operon response regulator KdpE
MDDYIYNWFILSPYLVLFVAFERKLMNAHDTLPRSAERQVFHRGEPYILLIGTDHPAAWSTLDILKGQRFPVVYRDSGTEGLKAVADAPPSLVVLNLGRPDRDGIGVCRAIHTASTSPILVVSTRKDEESLVAMLDSGADDYVEAPVRPDELRARVRALLRRSNAPDPVNRALIVGGLEIDVARRRVGRGGVRIPLTRTEFDILLVLAMHRDQILTQEAILRSVWGPYHGEYVQTLRVHIGHIRQKLEYVPSHPEFIKTEPSVGYWLSSSSDNDPKPVE